MENNTEKMRQWSIHLEFLVIFITLVGGYFLLDSKIEQQCLVQSTRIDQVNSRVDQSNTRLDQLYTMFIDLVKDQRKS